jgi:hypothetical protein
MMTLIIFVLLCHVVIGMGILASERLCSEMESVQPA